MVCFYESITHVVTLHVTKLKKSQKKKKKKLKFLDYFNLRVTFNIIIL